jgi:pSer/pThr/pTyr-binding forkhead associated (FHA) protein
MKPDPTTDLSTPSPSLSRRLKLVRRMLFTYPPPREIGAKLLLHNQDENRWLAVIDPFSIGCEYISNHHCYIYREQTSWRIMDLYSTNGTYVNGIRIDRQFLKEGDQISIGSIYLIFLSE